VLEKENNMNSSTLEKQEGTALLSSGWRHFQQKRGRKHLPHSSEGKARKGSCCFPSSGWEERKEKLSPL